MCASIIPDHVGDVENLNVVAIEPDYPVQSENRSELVDLDESKPPLTNSRHIIFEQIKKCVANLVLITFKF